MSNLFVTGITGFVGQHLLKELIKDKNHNITVFGRRPIQSVETPEDVDTIVGFWESGILENAIKHNSTVINLAYLIDRPQIVNLQYIEKLIEGCLRQNIKKLIHLSTASVSGRVKADVITENTPCFPYNEYEKTKLKIEELLKKKQRIDLN